MYNSARILFDSTDNLNRYKNCNHSGDTYPSDNEKYNINNN